MRTSDRVHELFLNYACTAKCGFCYNPPITPELLRLDLSFQQAAESLYAAAKGGATRLNLHGGEVTLRDDLPAILRLARKLGFSDATVVTNGVRLAERSYVETLLEAGATHFRLSIHSDTAEVHDRILAIPQAFAKATAGLAHLQALRRPVGLNFVLNRLNLSRLPAFLDEFCLKRGVEDVIVYFPHLRGMMALNADALGLTYEEAAPKVREGAALLSRAGAASRLLLANFVPCALPELAGMMLDWAREDHEASMIHPEGAVTDLERTKDLQRRPVAACARCPEAARCRGVEREYVERWGERGFSPLEAACR